MMLKYLFLCCSIVVSLAAFDYHLQPKRIAKDVYCFFGALENISKQNGGNMVNTCFVQTKEGFVVIDSGPNFAYAFQAYAQMQKIAKLPVKYVINTHDHDDHWLGNSFYKEKDALLIGPLTYEQNIVPGMQTRMERVLGERLFAGTKIVPLDKVVKNRYGFSLGGKEFVVTKLVNKAHTEGDLVVSIPKEGVLFAGDILFNGRLPSLRDGSILGSIKALDIIDQMNVKVVVGGHGYLTDKNTTKMMRGYLTQMKRAILNALDNDVSMNEITKKVNMPQYKKFKLYDVLHRRNVLDVYRELELCIEEEE